QGSSAPVSRLMAAAPLRVTAPEPVEPAGSMAVKLPPRYTVLPLITSTRTVPFACHVWIGFEPTIAASATDAIASMAMLTQSRTTPRAPVLLTPASSRSNERAAYGEHPTRCLESVNL